MKWSVVSAVVGGVVMAALACGSEEAPGSEVYGGAGGQGGAGAGAAGAPGGAGPGAAGGFGALGGVGGAINFDSGPGSDANPDAPCEGIRQDVKVESLPVDIVWAVDNSLSMVQEALSVQENINAFSQQIIAANIDVHVVMLAGYSVFGLPGVCVPPPLGTGQCPGDSKPPNFFHHPSAVVDSWNAAAMFVQMFPEYRQMMRPNSLKYLVVVTDDDSSGITSGVYTNNPNGFITDYTALDPMMQSGAGRSWKMSGVYAQTGCPNASRIGTFWKSVIDQTGGVHGDICACADAAGCTQTFRAVLDSLAKTITTAAKPLDCEYAIPAAPAGQTFDKTLVNVDLLTNGATENIGYVPDMASCHPDLGGWYYDDPNAPTRILTCPKSCDKIKATTNGSVAVAFGCKRKDIPIAQ
jgi:hypothetical protein